MPYDSIKQAKDDGFITKLDDVPLTLGQINEIARTNDALKKDKKVKEPMAVAISQFRERYKKEGGKWVKKEKTNAKRYVKDIISPGTYYGAFCGDPEREWTVTTEDFYRWIENTERIEQKVWIPYGMHTSDPSDNTGWVEKFYVENSSLKAIMDITDAQAIRDIDTEKVKEVSIGVDLERVNSEGKAEEVITHVAIVLDPVVTGQDGFIPISGEPNMAWLSHSKLKPGVNEMADEIKEPENLTDEGKSIWEAVKGLWAGYTTDYEDLKKTLSEIAEKIKANEPEPDKPVISEEVAPVVAKVDALEKTVEAQAITIRAQRLDKANTIIGLKAGTPEDKKALQFAYETALDTGDTKAVSAIEAYIKTLPDDHKATAQFGPTGPELPETNDETEKKIDALQKDDPKLSYMDAYLKVRKEVK